MKGYVFIVRAAKTTLSIWVRAEHMVVDQQVTDTEVFDSLCVSLYCAGIGPDFVVWKYRADLHNSSSCLEIFISLRWVERHWP